MPKRISDRQRIISYAMSANAEQLQDAIETFKAIQTARFPKEKAARNRKAKPRGVQLEIPGSNQEAAAAATN